MAWWSVLVVLPHSAWTGSWPGRAGTSYLGWGLKARVVIPVSLPQTLNRGGGFSMSNRSVLSLHPGLQRGSDRGPARRGRVCAAGWPGSGSGGGRGVAFRQLAGGVDLGTWALKLGRRCLGRRRAAGPVPVHLAWVGAAKGQRAQMASDRSSGSCSGLQHTWTSVGLCNLPGGGSRQPVRPLLLARPAPCRT